MRLWPHLSWVASLAACLLVIPACGGGRSERIGCTDSSTCETGEVCLRETCTSIESASVEASAEATGAAANIYVIDAAGNICEASSCKDLPYGSRVTFRVEPPAGARFTGWSGSPECSGSALELVVEMLTRDTHCIANFVLRRRVTGQVVGVEGGGVTASSSSPEAVCSGNSCEVDANAVVTLEAMDRWGERFVGWTGAGCEGGLSRTIEVMPVETDISCTASFQPRVSIGGKAMNVEAVIEVTTSAEFQSCEPGSCVIDRGESAVLNAPEVPGFRFAGWSGTDACTGENPRLVITNAAASQLCLGTYLRRFRVTGAVEGAVPPPDVRAVSSDQYAACEGAACEVDNHGTVTLVAWSAPGFRLQSWSGAGCGEERGAALEIADVTSDLRCVAGYVPGIAVMGLVVGAPGDVKASSTTASASCAGSGCIIPPNGSVTLEAPVIGGYRFQRWKGEPGCEGTDLTLRFDNVTASKTCEAEYFTRFVVRGRSEPSDAGSVVATSANVGANCNANACTLDATGDVTLEAVPATGYRFSGWSGGGACTGSASAITVPNVVRNVSCQANFVLRASVTGIASPENGGRVEAYSDSGAAQCMGNSCTVDEGSRVELMATPAVGFRFAGWSECATESDPALRIDDVQRPVLCRATFVPLRFTVSSSAEPAAGGDVSAFSFGQDAECRGAACTVNYGSDVQLTANPAVGFRFVSWSGCSSSSERVLDVRNVRANTSCRANFTRIVVSATAIADPPAGGGVSASSTSAGASCTGARCAVPYGGAATLVATPARGYRFTGWSGCGPAPSPTLQLDGITRALECRANFELTRWAVAGVPSPAQGGSVVASSAGSATCREGRCSVDFGASVTLSARANVGFRFTGWSGCPAARQSDSITVANVSGDVTCQAGFERLRYAVAGAVNPAATGAVMAGSTSPGATCAGAGCTVNHGSTVVLTAVETPEYRFASWSNCPVTGGLSITLPEVTAPITCTANFARRSFVVTGLAMMGGSVAGVGAECAGNTCTVPFGGTATFVAAAAPGFRFAAWMGCTPSPGNPLSASVGNVTGPAVCTALFQRQFTVTATVGTGGTAQGGVSTSCGASACTVDAGAMVTVTAAPSNPALYEFAGWQGCSTSSAASIPVLATGDLTCIANFRPRSFTVTARSADTQAGIVSAVTTGATCAADGGSCSATVILGDTATFAAEPRTGFQFGGWSGANCEQNAQTPLRVSATSVAAGTTCTATFTRTTIAVGATTAGGGSIMGSGTGATCMGGMCSVPYGGSVSFAAAPSSGFRFVGWSGCSDSMANPLTLTNITAPTMCVALFQQQFTVSAAVGSGGPNAGSVSTSCDAASCTVDAGSTVRLSANVNAGFRFVAWSGCSSATTREISIMPTANVTCTANFDAVTFTVTGAVEGPGEIVGVGNNCAANVCTVPAGDSATFRATPTSRTSRLVGWRGCTASPASAQQATISGVNADATCTAIFQQQATVSAQTANVQTGTVAAVSSGVTCTSDGSSCSGTVDVGATVVFTAVPQQRYRLTSWSGAGCQTDRANPAQVSATVDANGTTCVATFEVIPPPTFTVTAIAEEGGSIVAPCEGGNECMRPVQQGGTIRFVASPDATSNGVVWRGEGCAGDGATVSVGPVTGNVTCTASFPRIVVPIDPTGPDVVGPRPIPSNP